MLSEHKTCGEIIGTYSLNNEKSKFVYKQSNVYTTWSISKILKRIFLPVGYPDSVRPEYLTYQFWDSIQGISSYLRSVLTTRSVLTGVGVGSSTVTPLSAALAWILKDGFGMVGSLTFAYLFAEHFEIYTKEWRLFADVLNNVGLTLDLLSSIVPHSYFIPVSCVSVLSKSCCGLVAGATKARISAHFARTGHLADVTVKESTQETAVALCGLLLGALLTRYIGSDDSSAWSVFLVLLIVHQYSNYRLVKVLEFNTLNPQRCYLLTQLTRTTAVSTAVTSIGLHVTKMDLLDSSNISSELLRDMFPNPKAIAALETFSLPIYLTLHGPVVGVSLRRLLEGTINDDDGEVDVTFFNNLCDLWRSERFIISLDSSGRVVVCLQEGCTSRDIVRAHFMAHHIHQTIVEYNKSSTKFNANELLVGPYVKQTRLWFDLCVAKSLFGDEMRVRGQKMEDEELWNVHDMASLKAGDWRYKLLQ